MTALVISPNYCCWVDGLASGFSNGGRTIDGVDGAVGSSQVAVGYETSVLEGSHDRSRRVDGSVAVGAFNGAGRIERGDGAIWRPHEAVTHKVCVIVESGDYPRRIDALDPGQAEYGGARDIEYCEGTGGGAHEAMGNETCVKVASRDRARRVDRSGLGVIGVGGIDRGEVAAPRPQETVTLGCGVTVDPCDGARWVDAVRLSA